MTDTALKLVDIAITVYMLVFSTVAVMTLLYFAREPIITLSDDKTLVQSAGVQPYNENELYGYDILLSIMNVDTMTPYPRAIRINDTPVIRYDSAFIANKMGNLANIYSAGGAYKLSTMLNYKVTNVEYVYDYYELDEAGNQINIPHLRYTLEVVN